ncbi:glutathione S-transferase family protein [Chachezhania sediminis]|uniref:glutathione S-transferase family protein n=1 Tax=Chachezhania sediminis TaxID=2599291 RepID=UPI00131EB4DE|nr:glutathione S-transferase family protein [Chachezhania sediminis]
MILWGLMDSPFVRRVALALHHHGRVFEHRKLSVLAHGAQLREVSPLGRVPALTLDDGQVLTDSRAIIEWLDRTDPDRSLTAPAPHLLEMLEIEAIAVGLAEKAVGKSFENRRAAPDPVVLETFDRQIAEAAAWLDARAKGGWLVADRLTRADLALDCATGYVALRHPGLIDPAHVNLAAHAAFCEGQTPFPDAPFEATDIGALIAAAEEEERI